MKGTFFDSNEEKYLEQLVEKYCKISKTDMMFFSIDEYEYLQYLVYKYCSIQNASLNAIIINS